MSEYVIVITNVDPLLTPRVVGPFDAEDIAILAKDIVVSEWLIAAGSTIRVVELELLTRDGAA